MQVGAANDFDAQPCRVIVADREKGRIISEASHFFTRIEVARALDRFDVGQRRDPSGALRAGGTIGGRDRARQPFTVQGRDRGNQDDVDRSVLRPGEASDVLDGGLQPGTGIRIAGAGVREEGVGVSGITAREEDETVPRDRDVGLGRHPQRLVERGPAEAGRGDDREGPVREPGIRTREVTCGIAPKELAARPTHEGSIVELFERFLVLETHSGQGKEKAQGDSRQNGLCRPGHRRGDARCRSRSQCSNPVNEPLLRRWCGASAPSRPRRPTSGFIRKR